MSDQGGNNICVERKTCRICGSSELTPVISLGRQYIASIFVKNDFVASPEMTYPLDLVRCSAKGGCGLVQLKHTVNPDVMYSNYGYRSGTNEIMRANLRDIASKGEMLVDLSPGDIVLDIGCNDGTLLNSYRKSDIDRVGFDPANNVIEDAKKLGYEIINDYFSYDSFARIRPGRKAKIVTSIAMFYDLDNPCDFVSGVKNLLAEDGVWIIEIFYLQYMLDRTTFDTICHEHLEYYALRQIEWMLDKYDLCVHDIEFNDINGGSFRIFVRHKSYKCASDEKLQYIESIRDAESKALLDTDEPYQRFSRSINKAKNDLMVLIKQLMDDQKKIYIYGASTKGNTLLQFYGIDNQLIAKAADRNPDKWGLKTPITNISIVSEEEARTDKPDYFLVLPWHFIKGFVKREKEYLNNGGHFIVPLPEVRVINANGYKKSV